MLCEGVQLQELGTVLRARAWQTLHLGVVTEGLWMLRQAMLVDLASA